MKIMLIQISSSIKLIKGFRNANIILLGGAQISINDALLSIKSKKNLLSFLDIWQNEYHIETINEKDIECLYIEMVVASKKAILEKLPSFASSLYYAYINPIEINAIVNQKFTNQFFFCYLAWSLGYPRSIVMQKYMLTYVDQSFTMWTI